MSASDELIGVNVLYIILFYLKKDVLFYILVFD